MFFDEFGGHLAAVMLRSSSSTITTNTTKAAYLNFYLIFIHISLLLITTIYSSSHISFDIGSGAASQILREVAHQVLTIPRPVYISFRTHQQPLLLPLAFIDTYNRISYSNVTLKFYPDTVRLKANNLRVQTISNIAPNIWPIGFGDETVHFTFFVSFNFLI